MDLINLYIDPNDDETGVVATALVDFGAIEENFFAFKKDKKAVKVRISLGTNKDDFKPIDSSKQILAGALMIPDLEIYRNENGKEFNVKFSKETIEQIVEKFTSNNFNNAVNEMHDSSKPVNAVLFNHFIINRALGINPPLGQEHLPDGTWFGLIKVKDKAFWEQFILTGIYRAFSVEGYFYEEPVITENEAEKIKNALIM